MINNGAGTGCNQSGQMPATVTPEDHLTFLGSQGEVQEVAGCGGDLRQSGSKVGKHLVALGSVCLITNAEIFENFSNRYCHTDAILVAFLITFNFSNRF